MAYAAAFSQADIPYAKRCGDQQRRTATACCLTPRSCAASAECSTSYAQMSTHSLRRRTALLSGTQQQTGARQPVHKLLSIWQLCPLREQRSTLAAHSSSRGEAVSGNDPQPPDVMSLEKTRYLVETAMLAAVSGLAYLLSTILKLENSLGYFLPLPIVIASLRSGVLTGFRTVLATGMLLVVLLGPIRAMSYMLLHGVVAATMGATHRWKSNFWLSVIACAVVRMLGQLGYLVMSSFTMNENLFALLLSNTYAMLDNVAATIGMHGSPSTLAVGCMMFSLLLVNGLTYCFLLHVIYRIILTQMGFALGPLPGLVKTYLYAGTPQGQSPGGRT